MLFSHEVIILLCRALFGYEGQTDVLKLVGKGGLFNDVLYSAIN